MNPCRHNTARAPGLSKKKGDLSPVPTAAAVTDDGNIIVTYVFGGNPIIILDPDFNVIGNVTNAKPGFSRTIEVSPDGQDVYHTGYTNNAIYRYHSDDGVFGEYELVDTLLLAGMAVESAEFNPATGYLWVSAGSYLNLPNQHPTVESSYTPGTWYAYDTESGEIVDSLSWQFTTPGDPNERPRAIAFSPDGNTAYVGAFGTNAVPAVQKFTRADDTAIEPVGGVPEAIADRHPVLPEQPELGIGAVAPGGVRFVNPRTVRMLGLTAAQVNAVAEKEEEEMRRRLQTYRGTPEMPDVKGKTAILVDDGLATGVTALAWAWRSSNILRVS